MRRSIAILLLAWTAGLAAEESPLFKVKGLSENNRLRQAGPGVAYPAFVAVRKDRGREPGIEGEVFFSFEPGLERQKLGPGSGCEALQGPEQSYAARLEEDFGDSEDPGYILHYSWAGKEKSYRLPHSFYGADILAEARDGSEIVLKIGYGSTTDRQYVLYMFTAGTAKMRPIARASWTVVSPDRGWILFSGSGRSWPGSTRAVQPSGLFIMGLSSLKAWKILDDGGNYDFCRWEKSS